MAVRMDDRYFARISRWDIKLVAPAWVTTRKSYWSSGRHYRSNLPWAVPVRSIHLRAVLSVRALKSVPSRLRPHEEEGQEDREALPLSTSAVPLRGVLPPAPEPNRLPDLVGFLQGQRRPQQILDRVRVDNVTPLAAL